MILSMIPRTQSIKNTFIHQTRICFRFSTTGINHRGGAYGNYGRIGGLICYFVVSQKWKSIFSQFFRGVCFLRFSGVRGTHAGFWWTFNAYAGFILIFLIFTGICSILTAKKIFWALTCWFEKLLYQGVSLCFNFHDKNLMRVKNAFF